MTITTKRKFISSEITKITWNLPNFPCIEANAFFGPQNTYTFTAGMKTKTQWDLSFLKPNAANDYFLMKILRKVVNEDDSEILCKLNFQVLTEAGVELGTMVSPVIPVSMKPNENQTFQVTCSNFFEKTLDIKNLILEAEIQILDFSGPQQNLCNSESASKISKLESRASDDMSKNYLELYSQGTQSDIKIVMNDGTIFNAHTLILKTNCIKFKEKLDEATTYENLTGRLYVHDVSTDVMDAILYFIYSGRFKDDWSIILDDLMLGAVSYELNALKEFCDNLVVKMLKPENSVERLQFAKKNCPTNIIEEVEEYFRDNLDEIMKADKTINK